MWSFVKEHVVDLLSEFVDPSHFWTFASSAVISTALIAGAVSFKLNNAKKNSKQNFKNQHFKISSKSDIDRKNLDKLLYESACNFENSNILILHGDSGTGKTYSCRKLVNKCRSENREVQIYSCQQGAEFFVTGLYQILSLKQEVVGVSSMQAILDILLIIFRVPSRYISEDESKEKYLFWKHISLQHLNHYDEKSILIFDNFERIFESDFEMFENFVNFSIHLSENSNLKILFISNNVEATKKIQEITKQKNQVIDCNSLNFDEIMMYFQKSTKLNPSNHSYQRFVEMNNDPFGRILKERKSNFSILKKVENEFFHYKIEEIVERHNRKNDIEE